MAPTSSSRPPSAPPRARGSRPGLLGPRHRVIALALGLVVLSGCSNDGDYDHDSGSGDHSDNETHPRCSSVWVDDGPIPEDYEGCVESDGSVVENDVIECEDTKFLTTYSTPEAGFYTDSSGHAVETDPDVTADPQYQERLANC